MIDNSSQSLFLQNGHIIIYTGLLDQMDNIDQLAMVLGHEMAHAVLGHTVRYYHNYMYDLVMLRIIRAHWM